MLAQQRNPQTLACGFDKTNPIYQERTRKIGAKLCKPAHIFQNIPAFEDRKQRTVSSDTLRCHEMKIGVLCNNQRPALESLLRKSHAPIMGGPERSAKTQAVEDARRWFADPASRPAIMKGIKDAGYFLRDRETTTRSHHADSTTAERDVWKVTANP